LNSLVDNKTVRTLFSPIFRDEPVAVSLKPRMANIERLRIVSAVAVASFHVHGWFPRSIGVAGFIILILSFCAFVVNRPEPYRIKKLAKRKAQRLLKPWLFWSMVYGALSLVKMIYENLSFSDVFSPTMLLTGTWIHLWFLPFAFVAALILVVIHRRIVNIPDSFAITVAILIGTLCIFGCSMIHSRIQPPTPLAQWLLGLPAIPVGFAIGRIQILKRIEDRRKYFVFVILSAMAASAVCMVLSWLHNGTWLDYGSKFAIRYCVSLIIFCSALNWRGTMDPISRNLASLSYGIYLIHPLATIPFYQFGIAIHHPLVLLFLVLFVSSLIIIVFRKTPLKQFV